jgi:hypothetical protein
MTAGLDWMAGGTVLALTAGASPPPPPPAYNVVAVGDSITFGVLATLPYPTDLATVFGATANLGVPLIGWAWNPSGVRGAPDLISTAAADVYPLIAGPNYPWLIGFAGTNDGEYGDTAAAAWASAETWIEGVLATGFPASRLIIPTMLPRTGLEPFRTAYNGLIVTGAATYGYQCARLDLDPNIGQYGDNLNPIYYEQTYSVHPTNAGHQIIANIIGAILSNVLPALPPPQDDVFYVRSDGADTNDGKTAPWLTPNMACSAPAGSTVYFWGGETFQFLPRTAGFVAAGSLWNSWDRNGVASILPVANPTVAQATIMSNNNGTDGFLAIAAGATVGSGIKGWGDNGGTWWGIGLIGTGAAFHGRVGGFYNLGGDGSAFGSDVSINCANPDLRGAIIGGDSPSDHDQNGIIFEAPASGIVEGFTIQNIGGDPRNPQQTGFGWHTNGIYNGPEPYTAVPLTFTDGVPNNYSLWIRNFVLHDCGWNITNSGGGGPSGGEVGAGGGVYVTDAMIYNIRPNPATFQGGSDFTPLDVGDDNAQWTWAERIVAWNCYGGVEDYANGGTGTWGPSTLRYSLFVNCGQGQPGAAIVQGNGTNGVHYWYNNTFIQTEGADVPQGSNKNVVYWQMENGSGIFANNVAVTGYPWYALLADGVPGAGFITTNCGWVGAGAGYSVAGQVSQTLPAFAATNARTDNPEFVGAAGSLVPTDYVLQAGSPYRGAGINVAAVYGLDIGSTDLFGNPVNPLVAPHIGAHAFG